MSKFEYVSVALALVYSFIVARLVSALPAVLDRERRYWLHVLWLGVALLATISTWWTIWDLREVSWNPLRFMWALSVPALIHLRVGILVSDAPAQVESWRAHYYDNRVAFFGVGVLIALNFAAMPWVLGFQAPPELWMGFAMLLSICLLGLASARPMLHGWLVVANLGMILGSFVRTSLEGSP